MKRSDPTVDWPLYFDLVERKRARKAKRKDMYQFIRMATVITVVVVLIEILT